MIQPCSQLLLNELRSKKVFLHVFEQKIITRGPVCTVEWMVWYLILSFLIVHESRTPLVMFPRHLSCCAVLSFEEQWHVCHQWLLCVWYVVHSKIPTKSENIMPIILPLLSCVWNILGFSKLWCCHWMECCFVSGFHWWFHVSTFVTITKMNVPRYVAKIQNFLYKIDSYIGSIINHLC